MKKMMMTLMAMVTMTISAQAMSYEQAREQALFLTDKMAYELNLTEDQYEAAYEVNLDYLLGVETQADLYGTYWTRRNLDLSYILLDWQYNAFCAASYFYRPLYWDAGFWHFGIYARYPRRSYFYFGRPNFWYTYRGAHAWHMNGGRSWYHGRTFGAPHRTARDHRGFGMRNGFDRGDFRGRSGNFGSRPGQGRVGSPVRGSIGNNRPNGNVNRGNNRDMNRGNNRNGNGNMNRGNNGNMNRNGNANMNRGNSNFGGSRQHNSTYNRQSSTRQTVGRPESSRGASGMGPRTSTSSPSRTFSPSTMNRGSGTVSRGSSAPSRSNGSFGGSSSRGSSSMGSGSHGGSSHSSGGHFGGGRR